jgi:hypothetical protein
MTMENLSLSDIAAVTDKTQDSWGGGSWWIIVLFLFAFMGNGMWGNGSNASLLTQADLQRAIDLNSIQNGQRDIEARVQEVAAELTSTVKDSSYNNLSEIRDLGTTINAGFANMQQCCCDTKQMIMQNRYEDAINTANINANTTSQTQKILDALAQNKIDSLQAQVSELKTQNMFCGVPRISPYGYGVVPQYATCGVTF